MKEVSSLDMARRQVRTYAASDSLAEHIYLMGAPEDLSAQECKRFEYALMIGPLSRGLSSYLEGFAHEEPRRSMSATDLLEKIGYSVASKVIAELKEDPNFPLISLLARIRSQHLDKTLAENIYPVGSTIITASISSANAMYDSAAANALTAKKANQALSRRELIEITKRSHQLPLRRTMATLAWQQAIDEDIFRHATAQSDPILEYDAQKNAIVLSSQIEDWDDSLNLSGHGQGASVKDIPAADEHIGCPVSFNPKLATRYYEHMVDMIEYHQAWPSMDFLPISGDGR